MDLKGLNYYHRVKIQRKRVGYMIVFFHGESKPLPKWESVPM